MAMFRSCHTIFLVQKNIYSQGFRATFPLNCASELDPCEVLSLRAHNKQTNIHSQPRRSFVLPRTLSKLLEGTLFQASAPSFWHFSVFTWWSSLVSKVLNANFLLIGRRKLVLQLLDVFVGVQYGLQFLCQNHLKSAIRSIEVCSYGVKLLIY